MWLRKLQFLCYLKGAWGVFRCHPPPKRLPPLMQSPPPKRRPPRWRCCPAPRLLLRLLPLPLLLPFGCGVRRPPSKQPPLWVRPPPLKQRPLRSRCCFRCFRWRWRCSPALRLRRQPLLLPPISLHLLPPSLLLLLPPLSPLLLNR
jgi:hypothetical protein